MAIGGSYIIYKGKPIGRIVHNDELNQDKIKIVHPNDRAAEILIVDQDNKTTQVEFEKEDIDGKRKLFFRSIKYSRGGEHTVLQTFDESEKPKKRSVLDSAFNGFGQLTFDGSEEENGKTTHYALQGEVRPRVYVEETPLNNPE